MTTNTVKIQKVAIDALEDLKALDIVTIDVRSLTDTMIICTGRSSRHVKSLAENVVVEAKRHKWSYINSEGQNEGEWIVVDLADVVVHVMQAETRKFYSLEDLWQMHANTHTRPR
jgi:ribosome-associated protein